MLLLRHHKLHGQKLFPPRHTVHPSVQGTLTDMEATDSRPARSKCTHKLWPRWWLISFVLSLQLGYAVELISADDMVVRVVLAAHPKNKKKKQKTNPAPLSQRKILRTCKQAA